MNLISRTQKWKQVLKLYASIWWLPCLYTPYHAHVQTYPNGLWKSELKKYKPSHLLHYVTLTNVNQTNSRFWSFSCQFSLYFFFLKTNKGSEFRILTFVSCNNGIIKAFSSIHISALHWLVQSFQNQNLNYQLNWGFFFLIVTEWRGCVVI